MYGRTPDGTRIIQTETTIDGTTRMTALCIIIAIVIVMVMVIVTVIVVVMIFLKDPAPRYTRSP